MQLATNILLGLILAALVVSVALAWLLVSKISAIIRTFVEPAGENQPSPLANSIDAVAQMFSRSITAQLKATFMGMQSGASRGEKAVQGDIAEDLAAASPLGGILGSFPTLKRSLRRNPGLLDIAMQVLPAMLAGKNGSRGSVGAGGSSGSQPKFDL